MHAINANTLVLITELFLTLLALAVAAALGLRRGKTVRMRRPVLTVFAVALAAGLASTLATGLPRPAIHDEFSYLLAADTFAHGRLSNPPHPLWPAFESFHINQQPTYGSMYGPANGMVLALGKVMFGHPWFGLWLANGAMCAAVTWMLRAWMPASWAAAGGMLVLLRLSLGTYWITSYWGGAVAATLGALAFGAIGRLRRKHTTGQTVLLAAAVGACGTVRPFETFALGVPISALLIAWTIRDRSPRWIAAPVGIAVAAGALLGYYNFQTTGDPARLPYLVNRDRYAIAQGFVWQGDLPVPFYRHAVMRDFYAGWERELFHRYTGIAGVLRSLRDRFLSGWIFFVGPVLTIPLFWLLPVARHLWLLVILGGTSLAILTASAYAAPHYAAPWTAVITAVFMTGIRHVRVWRRRQGTGRILIHAIAAILAITAAMRLAGVNDAPRFTRERVESQLAAEDGRHLVIVRYTPEHLAHFEWVYNEADIDGARVVWAREMDRWSTAELVRYFARQGRRVWLLEADRVPLRAEPYRREWLSPATVDVPKL